MSRRIYFIKDMNKEYQINVRDANLLMENNNLTPNVSYKISKISISQKHKDQTMPYQLFIEDLNDFVFFNFAKSLNRPSDNDLLQNSEHFSFLIKDNQNRIF